MGERVWVWKGVESRERYIWFICWMGKIVNVWEMFATERKYTISICLGRFMLFGGVKIRYIHPMTS